MIQELPILYIYTYIYTQVLTTFNISGVCDRCLVETPTGRYESIRQQFIYLNFHGLFRRITASKDLGICETGGIRPQ